MKNLKDYESTNIQDITQTGKFILFFKADWCPDCKFIEPFMPEIEAEYPDYQFIEVDRDEFMPLAKDLKIMGIPSFVAYVKGKEIGRFVNKDRKTKKEVEEFINSLK